MLDFMTKNDYVTLFQKTSFSDINSISSTALSVKAAEIHQRYDIHIKPRKRPYNVYCVVYRQTYLKGSSK